MKANVTAVVRIRPLNSKELSNQCESSLEVLENKIMMKNSRKSFDSSYQRNSVFEFDYVMENKSQSEVFKDIEQEINVSINSQASTIFVAYGPTGTGKTYTLFGKEDDLGLIPRVIKRTFNSNVKVKGFSIACTCIEIYNERVGDLLSGKGNLDLRENDDGTLSIGVKYEFPKTYQDCLLIIEKSYNERKSSNNSFNSESSRSHCIFSIFLMKDLNVFSKISFVDLAGSERSNLVSNTKESAMINKSLLALNKCLSSLCEIKKGSNFHTPYRESKLTRILKNDLSGISCKKILIATVSPSLNQIEETMRTLFYASNAKNMKNFKTEKQLLLSNDVQNIRKSLISAKTLDSDLSCSLLEQKLLHQVKMQQKIVIDLQKAVKYLKNIENKENSDDSVIESLLKEMGIFN